MLAFVDGQIHVYGLFVEVYHAVLHYHGVAITFFVIFVDNQLLVVFEILRHEFLLAEEAYKVPLFVGFLHSVLHGAVGEHFVAVYIYLMHLYLFVLVDIDVHYHLIFVAEVFALHYVHFGILETLVVEVALHYQFGTVGYVGVHLIALHQAQALLQVFALAFLHAVIVNLRYTRLLAQLKFQPCLVVVDFLHIDFHL